MYHLYYVPSYQGSARILTFPSNAFAAPMLLPTQLNYSGYHAPSVSYPGSSDLSPETLYDTSSYFSPEEMTLDLPQDSDDATAFMFETSKITVSHPSSHYGPFETDVEFPLFSPANSSPDLQCVTTASVSSASYVTSLSPAMSPEMIDLSPPADYMDEDEEIGEGDIEYIMQNVTPYNVHGNEYFRCCDCGASGHSCDFVDKRKCNLRYFYTTSFVFLSQTNHNLL